MSSAVLAPVATVAGPELPVCLVGDIQQLRQSRVRTHKQSYPDAPVASVSSIDQAPSARRRISALRAQDPAAHRQPISPRLTVQQQGTTLAQVMEQMTSHVSVEMRPVNFNLRVNHVLKAVGYVLLVALAAYIGLMLQESNYDGATVTHSVQHGESVWSLAASIDTARPLESVVADIERLNGLSGVLAYGQQIVLPVE